MDLVLAIVTGAGAQMDLFPSLHTALPTLLLQFAYRHRALLPLRNGWALLAGFVVNIVLATMSLRWHHLIDVGAGLVLALAGFSGNILVTDAELRRREGRRTSLWLTLAEPPATLRELDRGFGPVLTPGPQARLQSSTQIGQER